MFSKLKGTRGKCNYMACQADSSSLYAHKRYLPLPHERKAQVDNKCLTDLPRPLLQRTAHCSLVHLCSSYQQHQPTGKIVDVTVTKAKEFFPKFKNNYNLATEVDFTG